MKKNLISQKIEYCFFDKTFENSSNIYSRFKATNDKQLEEINNNRKNVASIFGVDDIITLNQVHGTNVVLVENNKNKNEAEADAMVTTTPGLALGIITADCVPVLFGTEDGSVIGAAHCGWKSTRNDIISATVQKMKECGAEQIKAVVGPAIQQDSYEVDSEFYNDFKNETSANEMFFKKSTKDGHYMFDLPKYVLTKLVKEGIVICEHINEDTYLNPEKYPSRRRSFHNNEIYKENILSVIMIGK